MLLEVRSGGLTEQLISKTGSAVHRWTHYLCTQLGDTRTPHSICLAWFVEIIVFFCRPLLYLHISPFDDLKYTRFTQVCSVHPPLLWRDLGVISQTSKIQFKSYDGWVTCAWNNFKQDHLNMNNSTGSNNHLRSIDLFRLKIIWSKRSKFRDDHLLKSMWKYFISFEKGKGSQLGKL